MFLSRGTSWLTLPSVLFLLVVGWESACTLALVDDAALPSQQPLSTDETETTEGISPTVAPHLPPIITTSNNVSLEDAVTTALQPDIITTNTVPPQIQSTNPPMLGMAVDVPSCPAECQCDAVFEVVRCVNMSLNEVPSGLPFQVKQLELQDNLLREISPSAFSRLPHLQALNMGSNMLESISPQAFANLPNLHTLDLHGNKLNQSQMAFLEHVPWLVSLNVSNNQLEGDLLVERWIPQGGGGDDGILMGIQKLDLSRNQLTSLPADVFMLMPNLTTLLLQDNMVTRLSLTLTPEHSTMYSVPATTDTSLNVTVIVEGEEVQEGNVTRTDMEAVQPVNITSLSSYNSLVELLLSNNRLAQIDQDFFDAFPSLMDLDLSNNQLQSIAKLWSKPLVHLTHLNLQGNLLRDVPNNVLVPCSNLTHLHLSSMPNLTHINSRSFAGLPHLQILDLSQCSRLGYVHAQAFQGLPNLQVLDLSFSNISNLHEETFANLTVETNIKEINLRGIPLACTCDTMWLENWLTDNPGVLNLTPNVSCSYPAHLVNTSLLNFAAWNLSCGGAHIHVDDTPPRYNLRIGESAVLTCMVGGEPAPSIHWETNRGVQLTHHPAYIDHSDPDPGESVFHLTHFWHLAPDTYFHDIAVKDRIFVLKNGSLYIDYVTRSDGGMFTCHAHNQLGNGTMVLTVKLDYSVMELTTAWSCLVGWSTALIFLFLSVTVGTIRHYTHFCSREEKEKRGAIRELLQTISEYKTEKFDTFKAYKSAKLDKMSAFKNHKLDKLRTYKQATVTSILHHMHSMREHYQCQVTRVKDNYTQQVDKLRDNYSSQMCKFKDYRMDKIDTVRDNYNVQAIKIRDYGSQQIQRLREQYKLQQQHLLKLLELLDIGNCMSMIEAECMRTDSMLFDPKSWELDQPVHVPPFIPPASPSLQSEYLTAAGSQSDLNHSTLNGSSQSDVTDTSNEGGEFKVGGKMVGRASRQQQHKRSSSDSSTTSTSSSDTHAMAVRDGREVMRMGKVRRKPRKKRKKWNSCSGGEGQHSAQLHHHNPTDDANSDEEPEEPHPEAALEVHHDEPPPAPVLEEQNLHQQAAAPPPLNGQVMNGHAGHAHMNGHVMNGHANGAVPRMNGYANGAVPRMNGYANGAVPRMNGYANGAAGGAQLHHRHREDTSDDSDGGAIPPFALNLTPDLSHSSQSDVAIGGEDTEELFLTPGTPTKQPSTSAGPSTSSASASSPTRSTREGSPGQESSTSGDYQSADGRSREQSVDINSEPTLTPDRESTDDCYVMVFDGEDDETGSSGSTGRDTDV